MLVIVIVIIIIVMVFMRVQQFGITRFHSAFGLICCGMREIAEKSINIPHVYRVYSIHIHMYAV